MALRRDIDKYLKYSFEELVELLEEQGERIDQLVDQVVTLNVGLEDLAEKLEERDEFIAAAFAADL